MAVQLVRARSHSLPARAVVEEERMRRTNSFCVDVNLEIKEGDFPPLPAPSRQIHHRERSIHHVARRVSWVVSPAAGLVFLGGIVGRWLVYMWGDDEPFFVATTGMAMGASLQHIANQILSNYPQTKSEWNGTLYRWSLWIVTLLSFAHLNMGNVDEKALMAGQVERPKKGLTRTALAAFVGASFTNLVTDRLDEWLERQRIHPEVREVERDRRYSHHVFNVGCLSREQIKKAIINLGIGASGLILWGTTQDDDSASMASEFGLITIGGAVGFALERAFFYAVRSLRARRERGDDSCFLRLANFIEKIDFTSSIAVGIFLTLGKAWAYLPAGGFMGMTLASTMREFRLESHVDEEEDRPRRESLCNRISNVFKNCCAGIQKVPGNFLRGTLRVTKSFSNWRGYAEKEVGYEDMHLPKSTIPSVRREEASGFVKWMRKLDPLFKSVGWTFLLGIPAFVGATEGKVAAISMGCFVGNLFLSYRISEIAYKRFKRGARDFITKAAYFCSTKASVLEGLVILYLRNRTFFHAPGVDENSVQTKVATIAYWFFVGGAAAHLQFVHNHGGKWMEYFAMILAYQGGQAARPEMKRW